MQTIDDRLSWDPQTKQLKVIKLLFSIVVIKRIREFIPKDEYLKIYNALFKSHISCCISSWGGVSEHQLKNVVFGTETLCKITFDQAEYYETCARVKTYKEHTKEETTGGFAHCKSTYTVKIHCKNTLEIAIRFTVYVDLQ